MASGYCAVTMIGNLTRKPETKFTPGGMAITSFGIAINTKRKSGEQWVDETTFVDVTFFGKRGEAFAKFHDKGALAFITGRLRTEKWQDKNTGQERSKLSVVADEFQFVGGRGEARTESRAESTSDGTSMHDPAETPF